MKNQHEKFIKRCYELAINAGKKGYDTFGVVLEKMKACIFLNNEDENIIH